MLPTGRRLVQGARRKGLWPARALPYLTLGPLAQVEEGDAANLQLEPRGAVDAHAPRAGGLVHALREEARVEEDGAQLRGAGVEPVPKAVLGVRHQEGLWRVGGQPPALQWVCPQAGQQRLYIKPARQGADFKSVGRKDRHVGGMKGLSARPNHPGPRPARHAEPVNGAAQRAARRGSGRARGAGRRSPWRSGRRTDACGPSSDRQWLGGGPQLSWHDAQRAALRRPAGSLARGSTPCLGRH